MKKVMVIGSGPIVIGQAAEFDYAGAQACRSLREEGIEVVLINSNPATIMTDLEMADRVYIEPLTVEFCEKVIAQERPDGLLASLGGQTGLNLATQLSEAGILETYGVQLLGTPLKTIQLAEDREKFRELMKEIREPVPESWVVESNDKLAELLDTVPYPCIVRPAYTLGGTGGGIANTKEELWEIGNLGLQLSMRSQILLERSLLGWKEIEYEVMRDSANNCIVICNMENFDPMGVHTGDSIVVAPSQTLSDIEYNILRSASIKIVRALGVEGGCNVQLAVNPNSFDYYVIEVNPRVSRSSALASKATGYPIARVSAKIALGKTLDQIDNAVTKTTKACFEPALDYCVVKIPRWPFDKFTKADRTLGTQMKATGEVMAIDRTFEGAMKKAIRGLELSQNSLLQTGFTNLSNEDLEKMIKVPTDERLWAIAEGLIRGWSVSDICSLCRVDPWFINKIKNLLTSEPTNDFSYKMVDTCAGEFESNTPYFYSCSDSYSDSVEKEETKSVLVLGSGPIRIGQGIEFDYSCVHCAQELHEAGYKSIILNNNPETVSTDFDTADALYFDPVTLQDALQIAKHENVEGVMLQFGGQTAINLADGLNEHGVRIIGTQPRSIQEAEDRDLFEKLLNRLGIPKPPGVGVDSIDEAIRVANEIAYPVLLRPSFVLGGRAMEIIWNDDELKTYMTAATNVSKRAPVLVDKYLIGIEAEVDVISDGIDTLIPGIMEHIEKAGVHSGDSMAVYPPVTLSKSVQKQMIKYACEIAKELGVKGLMNIQFVIQNETAYVLEVNPRASRTVPFLSKVTSLPMVQLATRCALGETLQNLGYGSGIWDPSANSVSRFGLDFQEDTPPNPGLFAVKAPVFSFQKLTLVEPSLGPEMKSTGEVMGIDFNYPGALFKAVLGAGLKLPSSGGALITVRNSDKSEASEIAKILEKMGFTVYATHGTNRYLKENGIESFRTNRISENATENILTLVKSGLISVLINTPSEDRVAEEEAMQIRRACVETGIPCITNIDTAKAFVTALGAKESKEAIHCLALNDYFQKQLVNL